MLTNLSLRLRIFLFFCLLAFGGIAISAVALWISYARAGNPDLLGDFIFAEILIAFGLLALIAGVWLLFDDNIAKPIERLSAQLRARAHAGVSTDLDMQAARYLGDLAPAAAGLAEQLASNAMRTAEAVASETAYLAAEKQRLTALLTEIPVAMLLASPKHQIVLYDGQAAEVLAQIAHPRLNASLFEYIEATGLTDAYAKMGKTGKDVYCTLNSVDGRQTYSARMKPLGDAPGYMLVFEDSAAQMSPDEARPLVYDFELLDTPGDDAFENRTLSDLCFVVFDTETTGLLPHKDEIVQIGAVRVLNGKIVQGEHLDMLVDPGIPIPPASTKVHKVSDRMVQGAPDITEAGRVFHQFARDAVIVAHNAPFDMAFLRRHAKRMEVEWDHPILDTVLLSAVLFGASDTHTLDALCERLEITIPEALRHTALGDAVATAEALVKMLPILQARGMTTFGEVIIETRKHGRLLEDLN
ncbi:MULTISPECIES: exonuclease domain-containing protein [unclassified Ruegeria]|uniref:3'-5' exonuclease n=1 Tax=unclassified Ruegeria TaxID=2625375 RepID=UPI001490D926|nr:MULTISPECIES: exonuclease domain-containing protein [unclassified Ruegeria]NOD45979.1 3'-5' exonuclease [Ruegeria sp. HKCCD5849]NOD50721.1 3'-5' exonuclease [Ruegeria sp. HKCCD5851]NOD67537.1 3'-5' exonuclease [Ruegeria sp. HKCCD7303]